MNQNMVGARTLAHLRGEKDMENERKRLAELKTQAKGSGLAFWLCNPQKRRVQRFWQVVSLLQENSRISLTKMSRRLDVPISTLFDLVKEVEKLFRFTVVLGDGERNILAVNVSASLEFSHEFTAELEKGKKIPLQAFI